MHMKKRYLAILFLSLSMSVFSSETFNQIVKNEDALLVYKTPSCGCCKKWIAHLKEDGLNIDTEDLQNLDDIKSMYGIKPQYRSCHTAVSSKGFIFEGHIPSKYVTQFLSEDHSNAIGLSVPGMPLGSPGMEVDDLFMPYEVLILYKDGTSEAYAEVKQK